MKLLQQYTIVYLNFPALTSKITTKEELKVRLYIRNTVSFVYYQAYINFLI